MYGHAGQAVQLGLTIIINLIQAPTPAPAPAQTTTAEISS